MKKEDLEQTLDAFYDADPHPLPQEPFLDRVIAGLTDKTLGYLISSLAALFLLSFVLPQFYTAFARFEQQNGLDTGLLDVVLKTFCASGSLMILHAIGFFIGGTALFCSIWWARPVLLYLFTYWGLAGLFEIRYALGKGMTWDFQTIVMMTAGAGLIVCLAIGYQWLQRSPVTAVRVFSVVNVVLTLVNSVFVMKFFYSLSPIPSDRHIQYLSLNVFAVIVLQMYYLGSSFFPAWKGFHKTESTHR